MKICSVQGCNKKSRARNLCNMHYLRLIRKGGLTLKGTLEPVRNENGQGSIERTGYRAIYVNHVKVLEHIHIVETVLGHKLPKDARVHHIDGDKINNEHSNLVVLANDAEHLSLHKRQRALEACGNPNYHKCIKCKKWDNPNNMKEYKHKAGTTAYHRHKEC